MRSGGWFYSADNRPYSPWISCDLELSELRLLRASHVPGLGHLLSEQVQAASEGQLLLTSVWGHLNADVFFDPPTWRMKARGLKRPKNLLQGTWYKWHLQDLFQQRIPKALACSAPASILRMAASQRLAHAFRLSVCSCLYPCAQGERADWRGKNI